MQDAEESDREGVPYVKYYDEYNKKYWDIKNCIICRDMSGILSGHNYLCANICLRLIVLLECRSSQA